MGKVVVGVVGRLVRNGTTEYTAVVQDAREHGSDADGRGGGGGGRGGGGGGGDVGVGATPAPTPPTPTTTGANFALFWGGGRREEEGIFFLTRLSWVYVAFFLFSFTLTNDGWEGEARAVL